MLDFIFRRGNPTNDWRQSPDLSLTAVLDEPSLNGVQLGEPFERLSMLGRSDDTQFGAHCFFGLGVAIDRAEDGTFRGFSVVLSSDEEYCPFPGVLLWKGGPVDTSRKALSDLTEVFGEWYFLDTDDEESIAFYEYPTYEMQIELAPSGSITQVTLTSTPIMADPFQREAYGVDKPWPPQHHG